MKHLLSSLLLFALGAQAYAQKVDEAKVPAPVKAAFSQRFPKAEGAKWEMEDKKDYEADFKLNGGKHSACFNADGKWLESETEIKATELPPAVMKAIETGYADHQMKEAERVETADGVTYEVELTKGTSVMEVRFDASGKKLASKNEKDEDEEDND